MNEKDFTGWRLEGADVWKVEEGATVATRSGVFFNDDGHQVPLGVSGRFVFGGLSPGGVLRQPCSVLYLIP